MKTNYKVKEDFYTQGFQIFPNLIPVPLLNKLKQLFQELIESSDTSDKVILKNGNKKYITNLENLCSKGDLSCLALLGFPSILAIAEQICGTDFFMIQEFAVIKNLGDGLPVLWHQDMLNERKGNCFTMGIYLDDADEDDGALFVIPESHSTEMPICESKNKDFIQIPVKAGDVLIHDMMLHHKSEPLVQNDIRRVLYFEFLSVTQVRIESIYKEELIQRRAKLIPAAIKKFKELYPDESSFEYKNQTNYDPKKPLKDTLKEIYSDHIRARPSAYCFSNFS